MDGRGDFLVHLPGFVIPGLARSVPFPLYIGCSGRQAWYDIECRVISILDYIGMLLIDSFQLLTVTSTFIVFSSE